MSLQEDQLNSFELGSISEHDQLAEEMSRRGVVIAQFYHSMTQNGLPAEIAGTIAVEWARAAMQAPPTDCGCDCDICRGA
jgi:hypothetical protein